MHYATALRLGRGVQKNEAEARKWFEAAAAEGSAEAAEFLRIGYHTGHRELNAVGAGTPTAAALAGGPTSDNTSLPQRTPTAVADGAAAASSAAPRHSGAARNLTEGNAAPEVHHWIPGQVRNDETYKPVCFSMTDYWQRARSLLRTENPP